MPLACLPLPLPGRNYAEAILGFISAAMALWNGYLHRRIRVLIKHENNAAPP